MFDSHSPSQLFDKRPPLLLNIKTMFDCATDEISANSSYSEVIRQTLAKILPAHLFVPETENKDFLDDQRRQFFELLPLFKNTDCAAVNKNISFFILSKYRPNAFKFFFEMISHWLVPGKRLNVVLVYAVDFQLPDFGEDIYTLCEIMVHVDSLVELKELQNNLPILQTEVRLGIDSTYYARRILEIKGLSSDAKTAMIQEYVTYLVGRLPLHFDYDVLTEMQHVLVICRDEFKAAREFKHLSRIISVHYLFRKSLHDLVKDYPNKRHISIKLFKALLHLPEGNKTVLAMLVGINFLRENEVFEERHLLSSIQNCIPLAKAVEGSFFANRRGQEKICTIYLEIEKSNGEEFTKDEMRILRRELSVDLKDRIEHLMHPIFMPRNEEEIMRNILSLSNQIKYLKDPPQMIISFDEQTNYDLLFTVIIVRILKPGEDSIQDMFKKSNTFLGFSNSRAKTVSFLRSKYAKEATIFTVRFPKEKFIRRDQSIDLNKARQAVVNELEVIIGEIRDFNGGMISKQNELLCAVREELIHDDIKYNELLLENFFYALSPDLMRTILDPTSLKSLFLMLLESIDKGLFNSDNYTLTIRTEPHCVYAILKHGERSIQEEFNLALSALNANSTSMANSLVQVYDIPYLSYIYLSSDLKNQQIFCNTIRTITTTFNQKKKAQSKSN